MSSDSSDPVRRGWPWPLIVCIGTVIVLDHAFIWLGDFVQQYGIRDGIWIGNVFGQACFAVMMCGLTVAHGWLAGFTLICSHS